MELSLSIDTLFRKHLDVESLGFAEFDFKQGNHAGIVKRRRNDGLVDILNYNYFVHGGDWSISNVFLSRVTLHRVDAIIKSLALPEDLHEIDRGAVVAFPGYDKRPYLLDPILKLKFGDNDSFSEDQLIEAARFMHKYIVTHILPFFDKITSLQAVNDYIIEGAPPEALSGYIPGAFMYAKKLVIMRLCDNPKYNEYVQWLLDAFRKNAEMDALIWAPKYGFHKRLAEYLDSGKYKEQDYNE